MIQIASNFAFNSIKRKAVNSLHIKLFIIYDYYDLSEFKVSGV